MVSMKTEISNVNNYFDSNSDDDFIEQAVWLNFKVSFVRRFRVQTFRFNINA